MLKVHTNPPGELLASDQKQKHHKPLQCSLMQAEQQVSCATMLVGYPGMKMAGDTMPF